MSTLIILIMSVILATVYIYTSIRVETQRQESRQKTRLHSLNSRFDDGR
ncbi:MAG: hypothetical protein ACE5HX_07640 [bacterium]